MGPGVYAPGGGFWEEMKGNKFLDTVSEEVILIAMKSLQRAHGKWAV